MFMHRQFRRSKGRALSLAGTLACLISAGCGGSEPAQKAIDPATTTAGAAASPRAEAPPAAEVAAKPEATPVTPPAQPEAPRTTARVPGPAAVVVEAKTHEAEPSKTIATARAPEPAKPTAEASPTATAANPPATPREEKKPAEPVKPVEPTTTRAALKAVDLRTIPKLNVDQKFNDDSTLSMYLSKSSLAGALAYCNAEMGARGWKENKGAAPDAKEYAMRTYTKDGYSIGLMLGASSDNQVSITLTDLGNVDMTTLPQPPDSQRLAESSPVAANYHTSRDIASTVDACRRAMKSAGWLEYRGYQAEEKAPVKNWDSHFIKNSQQVTFLAAELPPPNEGKVYAGYHAAQVLPFDLPVIPDATDLQLDTTKWYVNYKTPQEPARVADFYRKAYGSLGWEDRSKQENAPSGEAGGLLVFDDRKEARFFVQIVKGDGKEGGSKVAMRPLGREAPKVATPEPSPTPEYDRAVAKGKEEAARKQKEQQARERSKALSRAMKDEVGKAIGAEAGKIKQQTGIDVSKLIDEALKDDTEKSAEVPAAGKDEEPKKAVAFIAAESMPLPKGAKDISRDPAKATITYATTDDADSQEEFFNDRLKPMGWEANSVSRSTVNDNVHLTLGYGKDSVGLEVDIRYKGDLRTGTTVISGKGLRFDPAREGSPIPTPAKDDSLAAEDVQGLPIPRENNGHSAESSPFRKSIEARTQAPLDALAAFYRKELTARGWSEKPDAAKAEGDKVAMSFTGASGGLELTLTRKADETTVSLQERRTEAARKAEILPRDGRARLVIGNGFKEDAVIEINGKPYTVKRETGTKDPASAYKVDLFPGKNQLLIKIPGQEDQPDVVDCAAGDSWGLMIVENGASLVVRLY